MEQDGYIEMAEAERIARYTRYSFSADEPIEKRIKWVEETEKVYVI